MRKGKCNYLDDHDRNNAIVTNEEIDDIFFNMIYLREKEIFLT